MQDSTSSVKVKWTAYMEKAESHYLEDTAAVENGKKEMEEVLQNWYVNSADIFHANILGKASFFNVCKCIILSVLTWKYAMVQCAKG